MIKSALQDTPARRSHQSVKRGIAALKADDPGRAIPFLEDSLAEQKGNPDGYYYLALSLAGVEKFSAARDVMNAHTYVASALSHLENAEGSLRHMEQALVIGKQLADADPSDERVRTDLASVRYYYGSTLIDAGKQAEARRNVGT